MAIQILERTTSNLTEPYELEKYVAPGALFVFLFWIVPRTLFIGVSEHSTNPIGELAVLIIVAYVAGQVLEALRVYDWTRGSRQEFKHFKTRINDLLKTKGLGNLNEDTNDRVRTLLFTILDPFDRSELSWNLVRWQKMIVFAVLFWSSVAFWSAIMVLALLEQFGGTRLFRFPMKIVALNPELPFRANLICHILASLISLGMGLWIYFNALNRQSKNNQAQYDLIVQHFDKIKLALGSGPEPTATTPQQTTVTAKT